MAQGVDAFIMTYHPDEDVLTAQVVGLMNQTMRPGHLFIVNTDKAYFDAMHTSKIYYDSANVTVIHVSEEQFDHGATRDMAVQKSTAPCFLMLTQDAEISDSHMLERLYAAVTGENHVAVAYARQVPREDARPCEKLVREFNYPEESAVHTLADVESIGVKAYSSSDVCAVYRRDIFDEMGGFGSTVPYNINEDNIYAARAIQDDYRVAYVADAVVTHSHNLTLGEQFARNKRIGASHAYNADLFKAVSSEKAGGKMVSSVVRGLWHERKAEIPYFLVQCVCRYAGYLGGKMGKKK